jgi:hypothetical protein
MEISEELAKQIFFYSDKPRKDAVLADEVDIVQFANNVIAVARIEIAKAEHQRCIKIVNDMNSEVARALANQRPK